jgi:polysaccharide chain length determinant protein (PEP-CTERM system associated)
MSENRELTMDDYLAMLRRRLKVILIPALIAPIGGFLVSHGFHPRYTSQSTVLVEGQTVPATYVTPVITADFTQRVQTLSQEILSPGKLRPMVESLGVKPEEETKLISDIQQNMQVEPVITSMSAAAQQVGVSSAVKKKPQVTDEPVPGFTVNYSDSDAERAQKICNALTDLIVTENLKERGDIAKNTTDFLGQQLDNAKRSLDDQDAKLAAFKKANFGQLPTDVDNNMRMLASLSQQLDAATQTLSRAQQDKAYSESLLAQQIATWKTSQSGNTQTLQQGLTQLQAQLLQLQARYTDDYPDVIKTKADIAEIEKKLKALNAASASAAASSDTASAGTSSSAEPPEISQLRVQIHGYEDVIEQNTLAQKKLQSAINVYEGRTAMSPGIEEQYKLLTRDNDNAQALYKDLLAKKNQSSVATNMENQQEGEQFKVLVTAGRSETPSFPVRGLFAAAGLGVGLGLGLLIGVVLEFGDKSIRTEKDAAAIMDLPLLISVPWLGEEEQPVAANGNGHARRSFWGRGEPPSPKEHENVEV